MGDAQRLPPAGKARRLGQKAIGKAPNPLCGEGSHHDRRKAQTGRPGEFASRRGSYLLPLGLQGKVDHHDRFS